MAFKITLLPGDGIGPEVVDATLRAIDATGVSIEWERFEEVGAQFAEHIAELVSELHPAA